MSKEQKIRVLVSMPPKRAEKLKQQAAESGLALAEYTGLLVFFGMKLIETSFDPLAAEALGVLRERIDNEQP